MALNRSPAIILPPKLTKRSPSSFPLRQSQPTSACFKQPMLAAAGGNMINWRGSNWGPRSSSICWHGYRKTAIYVKLQDEATATAETKDGDHDPPSEAASNESSKASLLKSLQDHIRKVKDIIYQLTMKLDDDAIRNGLWKFLSETVLALAHTKIKILYSFYKNIVLPIYTRTTDTKLSTKPTKTLDDVEGIDAAKDELREALLLLQRDGAYMKHGAKIPRGILLFGAPGTGKTLLAEAVAGEAAAEVSFFSVLAGDYAEVGTGAAGVRDLFSEAREKAPSIVFIDGIEDISRPRGKNSNHLHPALSQLLNEMNKTDKDESMILIIAATNRPETLDWELMGSSQFFKKVQVDKPDRDGRRKIFALYMKDLFMVDKESICNQVASLTEGFVGGDLKSIAGDSRRLAARREHIHVTLDDVLDAVEGFRSGPLHSFGPRVQEFMEMENGSMGFGSEN